MVSTGELSSRVYERLRRMANRYLDRGSPESLRPTEIVHEAYVKLARGNGIRSEEHYLAVAATAMRQVLLDHVRDRKRLKRGGNHARVTLHEDLAVSTDVDIVELTDALQRLEKLDPRAARVVELKVFAGLPRAVIAEQLGVSLRTVANDWAMARAWMRSALGVADEPG